MFYPSTHMHRAERATQKPRRARSITLAARRTAAAERRVAKRK